jgi:hypothetical protein
MANKSNIFGLAAGVAIGAIGASYLAANTKKADSLSPVAAGKRRYLIFGKNGWIGGMMIELLTEAGEEVRRAGWWAAVSLLAQGNLL